MDFHFLKSTHIEEVFTPEYLSVIHLAMDMIATLASRLDASCLPDLTAQRICNIALSLDVGSYIHWSAFPPEFNEAVVQYFTEMGDHDRCIAIKYQLLRAKRAGLSYDPKSHPPAAEAGTIRPFIHTSTIEEMTLVSVITYNSVRVSMAS